MSAQGVELAVRGGGDLQETEAQQGSKGATPATGLHVVFSVTSAYTKEARLCHEDAVRLSLPTFEATPAFNFQQTKQSIPSPVTTSDTATLACFATAESKSSTLLPPAQNSGGLISERRSPSSSVAMAAMAPCLPTPPISKENSAATRPSVETSAPTGTRATAAVPKALARSPFNRTAAREGSNIGRVVGGELSQNAAPSDHGDRLAGVKKRDQHRPGHGGDSGHRDSRENETGGNERYLRDQSSPIPPEPGSPSTPAAGQLDWENRSPVKKIADGERSTRKIDIATNPATDPYHAQQRKERGAERAKGMVGRGDPSTGRLRWNPAWEQPDFPPPSPESAQVPPTSHRPTLPYIQRHVDNASPQSAFGHQDSSGWGESCTTRDANIGADRYIRPAGYYAHEPPTQGKRHEVAGGSEDKSHLRYHRPIREQPYHAAPRYGHRGYFSDGQRDMESPPGHHSGEEIRGRGGVFPSKVDWDQRRYPGKHSPGVIGTDRQLRPGNKSTWGGNDVQHPARAGDNRRSRWREESDEGWTRSGPPELRRKSEQDIYLAAGYGNKPVGSGPNGEEDPRRYRSDQRGKRNNILSDSRHGGYRYGGGLPPSGKPCWEPTKTAAVAATARSDPSRENAVARGRIVTGRGALRAEPSEDELEGREAYYARKQGGYSRPLTLDRQARRGEENVGGSESVREYLYQRPSFLCGQVVSGMFDC